jgi:predicted DCC family thiol-disulfide oxidoreductase YuxK
MFRPPVWAKIDDKHHSSHLKRTKLLPRLLPVFANSGFTEMHDSKPFEVFYDEQCPLCRKEINFIRKRDKHGRLTLTDISAADFDASSTGKSLEVLMREIHGRYSDGSLVTGVEVFREIYQRIGFGAFVVPTRWVGVRWAMDRMYNLFAALRYRHAKKRMEKQSCPLPTK